MKKVGIVTVYKNINYGSKLQNYALQYKLGYFEYNSETISITSKNSVKIESKLIRLIKNPTIVWDYVLKNHLKKSALIKRKKLFDEYLTDYIKESNYNTEDIRILIEKNQSPYDLYICGSDQIWAPNQFNEDFFLAFVNNRNKKIAYAPSIGLPAIPDSLINKYKELIDDIQFLSIREKDGAYLIKEITGREAQVVLDPTLLLSKNEWRRHAIPTTIKDPYVLCYFLGTNKIHRSWVENLSKKTGYKIIVLPFVTRDFYWGDKSIFEAGPREFLGLVDGAKIICTDSYHGMLFSINFNKEFFSFLRFKDGDKLNQNSRVLNFLEKFNLKNRIVDLNVNNDYEQINWSQVNSQIEAERTKSLEFLKQSLRENLSIMR
jgi:hypothetical protein